MARERQASHREAASAMSSNEKEKAWKPWRVVVERVRKFAYAGPSRLRKQKRPSPPRIGLALSGGFAHGIAHLGVLKVLEEYGLKIDAFAGTSVGSIVATAYASGCPLADMIHEGLNIRWKTFGRWTVDRLGLATNERLEAMLTRVLRCTRFEDLPKPLAVVAADISTGETVVFRSGELIPPLRASCSFPGLFVPINYQGRLLVDGAIVENVPVAALQSLGVDQIIVVNVKNSGPLQTPRNIFQVIGQAFQISGGLNQNQWRKHCAVVIEPEVSNVAWDEFGRAEELILAGERAAREMEASLRALAPPRAVAE